MPTTLKTVAVILAAWIASIWPTAWTGLLLMVATSAMFLGMAAERHFIERDTARHRQVTVRRPKGHA